MEQSSPRSLIQYLAYLDLCIVTESNVEPWRRAAFFEETGETYQRTINVCLRPIEQLASGLAEGLEGFSINRSDLLSKQLNSPVDIQVDSRLHEALNDFQVLCSIRIMEIFFISVNTPYIVPRLMYVRQILFHEIFLLTSQIIISDLIMFNEFCHQC